MSECKHTTPDKMIRDLKGRLHCVCGYMVDQSAGFNIGYYPLFHKKNDRKSEYGEDGKC